tara:strand:+ start:573 stop:725 length:153 start_codon:yes stop_codon:yes gene_type:complete
MQMKFGKWTWLILLLTCSFVLSAVSCQGSDGDKIIKPDPMEEDVEDDPPN